MLQEQLKKCMSEKGLSQADIVRLTRLSPSYVSDLVNGKRGGRISGETLAKLSAGLRKKSNFFYPNNPKMRTQKKAGN